MLIKETNYGILIRLNREYQNVSLSTLANDTGLSVGQLSKIERGYELPTEDVLNSVFEALDLDFHFIKNNMLNIHNSFLDFYHSYAYGDNEKNMLKKRNEFLEKHHFFISVDFLLLETIYRLSEINELVISGKILSFLSSVIDYLNHSEKQIYYDCYGVYYKEMKKIDHAIVCLQKALDYSTNDEATSMIYYHMSMVYRMNRQLLKAYQSIIKAKELFVHGDNYIRSCFSDLMIANIYSTNGEYDEAISILKKCLIKYERLNIDLKEKATIFRNLIWIYIQIDQYEDAFKIIENLNEEVELLLQNNDAYIVYKIILFYEFGLKDEVYELCKKIENRYDKNSINHNFCMYYMNTAKTKTIRMKYLNRVKTLIHKSGNYASYRLLFKLLRRECTTERQFKELNDLMYQYLFNYYSA